MVRTDCCWNQCDWVTYLIILFGAIRTTGASFGFCNQIRDAEIRGMPDLHPEGPGTAPAKFRLRSWRDLGGFLAAEIAEISPRFRQDLKILAAKNSLKFSPRSRQDLKISSRSSPRSWQDLRISVVKNLLRILARLTEISKSWEAKTSQIRR